MKDNATGKNIDVTGIDKYNYKDTLAKVNKDESKLHASQQILINQAVNAKSHSMTTVWIIWLALGIWGGHRFYLHGSKSKSAITMLCLTTLGWLTVIFFVGWLFLLATCIWKYVDAFNLCQHIKYERLLIKQKLVKEALNK